MAMRRWAIICSFLATFTMAGPAAMAQAAPATPGSSQPPAATAQPAPAAQPAAAPKVDGAEIVKRANHSAGVEIDTKLKSWQSALDRIEEGLRRPGLRYNDLNAYRDDLIKLRSETEDFGTKLAPPLNAVEEQVQKLPPAPAAGQPPEPEQEAQLRAELNYQLGYLRSAKNSLDTAHSRINQLINTIQDIWRKNFTNRLFQPVPGIFYAATWETAPEFARLAADHVYKTTVNWWQSVRDQGEVRFLAGVAALLWLALTVLRLIGVRGLRRCSDGGEPAFWRRASSAAGVVLLRSLPAVIPLVFLVNAVEQVQAMPDDVYWLFYVGARSIIIVVAVNALVATVLSPSDHRWRLLPASNGAAVRISVLVLTLALVYGATTFAYFATRIVHAPVSLTVALTVPSNLIVALLVIAILNTPVEERQIDGLPSLHWMRAIRFLIWPVIAGIVVTASAGYLALSSFLAQQLIVTGSILALVYLLLLWADGFAQGMTDETSAVGSWLKTAASLDENRRQRLAVPVSLLLKFAVLICSVPLILLQWGYPWGDVIEWYHQFFFGFHIGSTQVTLAALVASIVVFILGYFAAKFFQGWLDARVLKPAGLSGGLRDSIRTGVGYIGVFAAALIALSYAGFNLANLAIVAGAFSVGIGFGLQSVVSNFVSGLILLAERPIKVGDLVVAGGEEGYVRKISVRSTEIETSDGANVLIPNSFFISEKVKNWTLRNNTGRVTIQASVSYGSDPRQVKAILLEVAKAHPGVMRTPAPAIDFDNIGAGALHFKLYAFVYDLNSSASVRTDLYIAILDAFNAAGILIPSQKTEVTLNDVDWLKDAIKVYVENAMDKRISANGSRIPAADTVK